MAHPSLYEILGIEQTAPPEAVRKAWKRKVLETHPDKLALDISEDERRAAEAQFRDVHQAFEILSDPAKRRVYDNGLNYLRAHIRRKEAQENLARSREQWQHEWTLRKEERERAAMEKMARAREERERARQEKLQRSEVEQPTDYEQRKRALEEAERASQERYHRNIMEAEMKYRERVRALEENLSARKEHIRRSGSLPRTPSRVTIEALNMANQMLQTDALYKELRNMNPQWEARRQAVLSRQSAGMSGARTA